MGKIVISMFIIDFDDTLFDTQRFKVNMHKPLLDCGVTNEDVEWSYQVARKLPDGQFAYSHARCAELLAARGYDGQKIVTELERVTTPEALQNLLLPGAIQFLETVKNFGDPLILLSAGDPIFQELKVRGSGIARFFDRLFMVSEKKEEVIAELLAHHSPTKYWLVNDKVDETHAIVKAFPDIRVVLKRSSRISLADYEESGYQHFETLAEIQNFILEKYGK